MGLYSGNGLATVKKKLDNYISENNNRKANILEYHDENEDITTKLNDLLSDASIDEIYLANGTYQISEQVTINKIIHSGKLVLKNSGNIMMGSHAFIKNVTLDIDSSFTASQVLLCSDKETCIEDIVITSSSGIIKNVIGMHFKGAGATCFNVVKNAHIRYCSTGIYIDSTQNWVSNITLDKIKIDYFNDYALRVGSDTVNNNQNSHHNISNISIQDTSNGDNERIGYSIGGAWSNYTNLVAFSDSTSGSYTPFHIPAMSNNLPEVIKKSVSNSITGVTVEGDPNTNGYAYMHNINNMCVLSSSKIPDKSINAVVDTSNIKPDLELIDNPTIEIPSSIQNSMITPGNITYKYENGTVTIKNNTTSTLYFKFDIKLTGAIKKQIKSSQYATALFLTNMNDLTTVENIFTCSLLDSTSTIIAGENIGHLGVSSEGQISGAAFKITTDIINAISEGDIYMRVAFPTVRANGTYTFKEIKLYNKLVNMINKDTISWIGTDSILS